MSSDVFPHVLNGSFVTSIVYGRVSDETDVESFVQRVVNTCEFVRL